ncbi:TPA: hypothetical protein EYP13_02135 [Candidatus Micrarchaeota archaeon]|nr:hypothetical protein [Candidatus Micrarchaeota archaeon]
MSDRVFRAVAHLLFIAVAVYLYVAVVQLWAGKWRAYFMRSGNLLYFFYLLAFTVIYVQIIKILWKWHVRALSGP